MEWPGIFYRINKIVKLSLKNVLIILQRITGLENSLLGFTSRIQPIIMSGNFKLDDFSAIDVVCFGTIFSLHNFLKI